MKHTIYHKVVVVILLIILVSVVVPHLVFSHTAKRTLDREITDQLTESLDNAFAYLEQNGHPLTDIETLFSAGYIKVSVVPDIALLDLSPNQLRALTQDDTVVCTALPLSPDFSGSYVAVTYHQGQYVIWELEAALFFKQLRHTNALSLLLSLVLGVLIALYAGRKMTKPILELDAATQKVAAGDFTLQIPCKWNTNDELSSLVNSFNIMTKELNSVEILRSDFISDISHEFKTPLTAIEGYAKLLQGECDPAERYEYAQIITEETRRLSTLAQNILTLNKIENDNISAQKTCICIDEQIRRALTLYEPKWSAKNLSLDLELEEVTLFGYELLLMQVWTNLIDNAIKFSPEAGSIALRLEKHTNGDIRFSIRNEGAGIPPEEQAHIFDKFYQGDKSRGSDGNGLGLSIVHRVIEMHQGSITVHCDPAGGTVFSILL